MGDGGNLLTGKGEGVEHKISAAGNQYFQITIFYVYS